MVTVLTRMRGWQRLVPAHGKDGNSLQLHERMVTAYKRMMRMVTAYKRMMRMVTTTKIRRNIEKGVKGFGV